VREPPVFHLHVRVAEVARESGRWLALFEEPDGRRTWMEQPAEPTIGDEQVLYIVRKGTPENERLGELVESGAPREAVEEYVDSIARKYGAWCEEPWADVRARQGGQHGDEEEQ
jgi:hypothetical protein